MKNSLVLLSFILTDFLSVDSGNAQERGVGTAPARPPHEVRRDTYVAVPPAARRSSPAYRFASGGFTVVQVNVDSAGMNIVGDAANEPSIAIDPTNPARMAIGWRQFDTITSDFRQAGNGFSTDGGQTWMFRGVLDPGIFRSDPVLGSDTDGNFYYYSLAVDPDYFCTLFKDSDGGASWDSGIYAFGGDKAWMAIDGTSGIGRNYVYFAWDYAGCCGDDWFTRSTDLGLSFDSPVPIPQQPIWGVTATGPDGSVFVAGRLASTNTRFAVAKSTAAQDSSQALSFDSAVAVDLGGYHLFNTGNGPNPGGLMGQVWIAADHSAGPTAGNIYVLCSVDPPGNDPLDVNFVRSTDGGATWSSPLRINDDPGSTAWQWFGTMSVSPNGRVDVVWLDTRNGPGLNSALYYAYSADGGLTWSQNEQLSESFNPLIGWPIQNKLGDYFDMISDDEGVSLAWAATFNGEQDVYYSRIDAPVTAVSASSSFIPDQPVLFQNYPNPFNPVSTFRIQIAKTSNVSLIIYDVLGREVATLITGRLSPGTYERQWDTRNLPTGSGQASGVYFYQLKADGFTQTRKLVLLQ